MAAEFISAEVVTFATGTATPASQSVTVPGDATAAYLFWFYYVASDGSGLSAATLNGNAPAQTFEVPVSTAAFENGTGVAAWYNPATGSQTLDVDWDATPIYGPNCVVVYTKGGDLTAWRDADGDAASAASNAQITLTTVSGDLLLRFDTRYDASETPPTNSSGWTSGATGGQVDYGSRFAYKSAGGSSEVLDSEDDSYSSIVAVSIPGAVAPTVPTGRGLLLGVG